MKNRLKSVHVFRTDNYVLDRNRVRESIHPYWRTDQHILFLMHRWDFEEYVRSIRSRCLSYDGSAFPTPELGLTLHDDMILTRDDADSVSDDELRDFVFGLFNTDDVNIHAHASRLENSFHGTLEEQPDVPVIPVGGWCGPAMGLYHMRWRPVPRPFDWIYVSMDGVTDTLVHGVESLLPERPPVPRELNFRHREKALSLGLNPVRSYVSRHAVFVHADFERQPQWFDRLTKEVHDLIDFLRQQHGRAVFIRAQTNPDWKTEYSQVMQFMQALDLHFPDMCPELVLILHDQFVGTTRIPEMDERVKLWCVHGYVGWRKFIGGENHFLHEEYCRVICAATRSSIDTRADLKRHAIRPHNQSWML